MLLPTELKTRVGRAGHSSRSNMTSQVSGKDGAGVRVPKHRGLPDAKGGLLRLSYQLAQLWGTTGRGRGEASELSEVKQKMNSDPSLLISSFLGIQP